MRRLVSLAASAYVIPYEYRIPRYPFLHDSVMHTGLEAAQDRGRPTDWFGARGVLANLGHAAVDRVRGGRSGATVRNANDLRTFTGVEVVGTIPTFERSPSGTSARPRPDPQAMDAYRALRIAMRRRLEIGARVVVLTSAHSGDGKTTTAAHLAMVMAHAGQRVLLIDAETRRGDQHMLWGVSSEPGFFDLLFGQASESECIRQVTLRDGARVDLLPSGGASQPNAAELMVAGPLAVFLQRYRTRYDVVLIDSPPLDSFTDGARIGAQADAVLFVARARRTRRQSVQRAVRQLRHVNAKLIGAVLNDAPRR